jgi:hypothetical protein
MVTNTSDILGNKVADSEAKFNAVIQELAQNAFPDEQSDVDLVITLSSSKTLAARSFGGSLVWDPVCGCFRLRP